MVRKDLYRGRKVFYIGVILKDRESKRELRLPFILVGRWGVRIGPFCCQRDGLVTVLTKSILSAMVGT